MELLYTNVSTINQPNIMLRGFTLVYIQLLRDASDGRVDIHCGDALEVDIPSACQEYVDKKGWEDGRCGVEYGR